jgi:hypothetical protein
MTNSGHEEGIEAAYIQAASDTCDPVLGFYNRSPSSRETNYLPDLDRSPYQWVSLVFSGMASSISGTSPLQ